MKKLIVLLGIIVLAIAGVAMWWNNGLAAANPSDKTTKYFVVAQGKGVREIANNLKEQGLIKDPVVFFLMVKQKGLDNKIQAGDFKLSPSMTASQVADTLTHGTVDIWVTIPEGKRADEIADLLKEKIPSYDESWRPLLDANEGYLFPDTYLIPKDATGKQVVAILTNTFTARFETLDTSKTKLTKNQIVTLASLVEREARYDSDRPLVASVLLNRLDLGMALQIDSTVQYALGYQANKKTWWKPNLTADDLKINSNYNTYLHPGLPPTPICNPGLSSMQAVVNPANTDYLYYLSDKTGKNHYAKTLEEHNANIRKYGL